MVNDKLPLSHGSPLHSHRITDAEARASLSSILQQRPLNSSTYLFCAVADTLLNDDVRLKKINKNKIKHVKILCCAMETSR